MTLPELTTEQRLNLEFAAGKCYEDCGEFDEAGMRIDEGNRLQRSSFTYEVADDLAVFGGGELQYLPQAIHSRLPMRDGVDCTRSLQTATDNDFEEIANRYLSQIRKLDASAQHVTDKLPNNFLHIGLIKAVFPAASIIHVSRDSRDTCWSIYKNFFSARGHYYAYEQTELGKYYCAYENLMAHWRQVVPGGVYDVCYENLVSDQESTTRALLEACGLPWDPASLDSISDRRHSPPEPQ